MVNLYETSKLVEEYLLLHFGGADQNMPWAFGPREALDFPARCVKERIREVPGARALELGCAVGRASFELSRFCEQVVGIDFSAAFIDEAQRLAREKTAQFSFPEEGELRGQLNYQLDSDFHPERVHFEVGDACQLREDLGSFDIVLAANLLCRLPEPESLLSRFPELVKPGGQLVLTSPYTWMEEYTPKSKWLGGYERGGEAIRSLDTLKASLSSEFDCLEVCDMPFLIREHSRKFQWCVAQASVWKRRGLSH